MPSIKTTNIIEAIIGTFHARGHSERTLEQRYVADTHAREGFTKIVIFSDGQLNLTKPNIWQLIMPKNCQAVSVF